MVFVVLRVFFRQVLGEVWCGDEQKAAGETASVMMASRWPPKMLPEGSSTFVDPDTICGCRLLRQRRYSADQ
jgi:hypothetical protein